MKHIIKQKSHYDYWLKKNWYYHTYLANLYQFFIPKELAVLQIGCKTGFLLSQVTPSVGVGVEWEVESLEKSKKDFPQYAFYENIERVPLQKFDYIFLIFLPITGKKRFRLWRTVCAIVL